MIIELWDKFRRLLGTSVAFQSYWMVGGQIGQGAIGFLSNLILVRYLFPEEFGRFALIQATISLVASTCSFRINTLLIQVQEVELQSGAKDRYMSALVGQTLLVCLCSVALLWFFNFINVLAIALLLNVLIDPWIIAQRILYERNFNYKNLSLLESGSQFASHLFSVIGVIFGLGPAVLYLRGWVLTLGHLGGLYFLGGLQGYRLRWLKTEDWRLVFHQVRGYWFQGWLEQSFERLVIMVIGLLEGQQMTGYFFQARRLAVTPNQLFEPVSSRILFNYLSHRASALKGIHILYQVLKMQFPVLLLIGALAAIGADPVIPWIFGPGWEPVIPLFQGMIGIILGMTPFHTMASYFKAQNFMWPFTVFGHGFQYAALAMAFIIIGVLNLSTAQGIAIGLSVGYIGGCCVITFALRLLQRKLKVKESKVEL